MGFFSTGKTQQPRTTDKVWKTREACLKGIVREALLSIKNGEQPIIMIFFEESQVQLAEFLGKMSVPCHIVGDYGLSGIADVRNAIVVVNAFSQTGSGNALRPDTKTSLFFLGHYPRVATETSLVEKFMSLFHASQAVFCQSLEDPVFEVFGNDRLRPMMKTLGMTEDECIEHAMVTRALRRALEKINQSIETEVKSSSEKEWFARNVKR